MKQVEKKVELSGLNLELNYNPDIKRIMIHIEGNTQEVREIDVSIVKNNRIKTVCREVIPG